MDVSINRNIRLGVRPTVQLQVDMFNAFNQAGTGRNTTMNLTSPTDPNSHEPAVRCSWQPHPVVVSRVAGSASPRNQLPRVMQFRCGSRSGCSILA
jgi:hypothetical protein